MHIQALTLTENQNNNNSTGYPCGFSDKGTQHALITYLPKCLDIVNAKTIYNKCLFLKVMFFSFYLPET